MSNAPNLADQKIMRRVEVQVTTACGTNGLPRQLLALAGSTTHWDANEANAFSLVAMVTAPPMYVGFSLADTWAHQRYFAAVDPHERDLSLCREWNDLDPHQKTILADDWGMGFPLLYLMEKLDLVQFAPTAYWIKSMELATGIKLALKKSKHGPPKLPDFVGFDTAGRYHAIECKGTQKSRTALRSAIERGIPQVENLRAAGALPPALNAYFDSWLVAGLYVPVTGGTTRPLLHIADPDFSPLSRLIDNAGGILALRRAISITALSQQLAAVGLRRLASAVFTGKTQPGDVDLVRLRDGRSEEAARAGFQRTGDTLVAGRDAQIFEPARPNVRARIRQVKSSYSAPVHLVESLTEKISDSGVVDRDGLDELLSNLLQNLPGTDPRPMPVRASDARPNTPWIAKDENGVSRLRSQFKIEITTALDAG